MVDASSSDLYILHKKTIVWFIDDINLPLIMETRQIRIVGFVHKKMSSVQFNVRKPYVGLGLNIENTDIFF